MWCKILIVVSLMVLCNCVASEDSQGISVSSASFDFNRSQEDWEGDFSDLPSNAGDTAFYDLKFAYTKLPANLGDRNSIMLSGNNHSDDLFMFIKRKITGLAPNTLYNLVFEVELASNAPKGSVGVGGSPGENVYLKAGASGVEPTKMIQSDQYVLNIDKGNQHSSGMNAVTLGDIAIPSYASGFTLITRSNASSSSFTGQAFLAQSNSAGEMWLIVGTDSGFEGTTTVYYTKVTILFSAPE